MIANLSDREFIIVVGCTNLRKGFDGLFYQLQQDYGTVDFFNNVGYVFINRRRNMFKCLYWENGGMAIWQMRLTKGTFASGDVGDDRLNFSELLLFIHGFVPPENRSKKAKELEKINLFPNRYQLPTDTMRQKSEINSKKTLKMCCSK